MGSDAVVGKGPSRRRSGRPRSAVFLAAGLLLSQAGPAPAAGGTSSGQGDGATGSLWINPGLYSIHFQDKKLNDNNHGIGVEYRYSETQSITAGEFKNSDWKISRYLSWYWQPFSLGPVKLGATIGALDGYPDFRDGGWFLAALPAATYEGKHFGLNVLLAPTYRDRIHGALSFQVKFRVW